MSKVKKLYNPNKTNFLLAIFCPGCECLHGFDDRWDFNNDYNNPTFSPSMLVNKDEPNRRCHSFIKNGKIEFLTDCYHKLAGKIIEIPDFDE